MTGEWRLQGLAAAAAASGVFAAFTGQAWAAVFAGLCSVATAVVALRAMGAGPTSASEPDAVEPAAIEPGAPAPEVVEELIASVKAMPATFGSSPQLLDEDHLASVLRGRVAVARRALRPLSVVHVMVLGEGDGPLAAELLAAAAEATLRESDIVGRRADGVYVFVLEDTAEDGAVWTTERLRRHVAGTIGPRRFQAGVASYPNHGLDADTVDASAARALEAAKDWDRDRIEVAGAI